MKLSLRRMIQHLAPQTNLRPAGVWDFIERPDAGAEGSQIAHDFEQLWALAEREAYAAGEVEGPSAVAQ